MFRSLCCYLIISIIESLVCTAEAFDFEKEVFGSPSTLTVSVASLNPTTGRVVVSGSDSRLPATPFTYAWGDGTTEGFFPRPHIYTDRTRNYVVTVTAHYTGGTTDSAQLVVRFMPPVINPVALDPSTSVSVPSQDVAMTSRMPDYGIPPGLTFFHDSAFSSVPRTTVEYVLCLASNIQSDLVAGNVVLENDTFPQVLLRDSSAGGMYSLWYTIPVSFGAADYAFDDNIQYSSFFHEMGHNFTLNTPSGFSYGGKIDGNANAIFSETMAQIYAHVTAYEIINNRANYGLSTDLAADIEQTASSSMRLVRSTYDGYIAAGKNYHSWNDPSTPDDETTGTFMTIAYRFFAHAEESGSGYRLPAKRMTRLLQAFNQEMRHGYNQDHDTTEADTFRATLMVAALSYGFSEDCRQEFRKLGFPIDDRFYDNLLASTPVRLSSFHLDD